MSGRKKPRPRIERFGMVLLLAALTGCGPHEDLAHGVGARADGTAYEVSSLMPSCGCLTLRNIDPLNQPVELVTRLHAIEVGSSVVAPGTQTRFAYDWAGVANDDTYNLEAYRLQPNATGGFTRGAALRPIFDYVANDGNLVSDCKKQDCPFGTLGMDQVLNEATAGGQGVERFSGVDYTSGGQQISAASTDNTCGCLMVSNNSPDHQDVTVRALSKSVTRGSLLLPWDNNSPQQPVVLVAFDWAGSEEEDRYLLSAMSSQNGTELAGDTSQRPIRIQDFVKIIGEMDQLKCTAQGAVFYLPAAPTMDAEPTASGAPPSQIEVLCPFGGLSMDEMSAAALKAQKK